MKKTFVLLMLSGAFLLASCDSNNHSSTSSVEASSNNPVSSTENTDIHVTKVELSASKTTLKVGEVLQLEASVLPSNATNSILNFVSSDNSVVSVDFNGKITARKEGSATIQAISDDDATKKAEIVITVEKSETVQFEVSFPENVEVVQSTSNTFYKLIKGESYPLNVVFTGEARELEATFSLPDFCSFDSKTNTLTALARTDSLTLTLMAKGSMVKKTFQLKIVNPGEKDMEEVIKKLKESSTKESDKYVNHYDISFEFDTVDINYENHLVKKQNTSYDVFENGSDYYMLGDTDYSEKGISNDSFKFKTFKGMDADYYYEYMVKEDGTHISHPLKRNIGKETVKGGEISRGDAIKESTLFNMNSHYGLSELALFHMRGQYESSFGTNGGFTIGSIPIYFGMGNLKNDVIVEKGNTIQIDTYFIDQRPSSQINGKVFFNHGEYTFNDEGIITSLSVSSKQYDEQSFDFNNETLSANPKVIRSYKIQFSQAFGDYHTYQANDYEPKNLYFTDYTPVLIDKNSKQPTSYLTNTTYYLDALNPSPKIASSEIDALTISKLSDKSMGTISSDGRSIVFKKAGTVTLTIFSTLNKVEKTLVVTVGETLPSSLKVLLNSKEVGDSYEMKETDKATFSFEILPNNASKDVIGSLSSNEFATLTKNSDGTFTLTALKEGDVTLTFQAGSIKKTILVHINKKAEAGTSLLEKMMSKTYTCQTIEETHSLKIKSATQAEFVVETDFGETIITCKLQIDETKKTIKFLSFETSDYDEYCAAYGPVIKINETYSILDENSFQVKLLEVDPKNNYSEVDYETGEEELSLYTFEAK